MSQDRQIHVAVVAGEESGDLLAADLVEALNAMTGRTARLTGVGGEHLKAHGLKTLFDPGEIALMGVTAVIAKLPSLISRINETARAIIDAKPDILLIVDSPDFTHRVARKVKQALPNLPVVNYVCPSVWAWRPGRARAMRAYVDHVLCLLPFEPDALSDLDGPPGTFVGHRLLADRGIAYAHQMQQERQRDVDAPTLLLLPGSRRSEVKALLGFMGDAVSELRALGVRPTLLLPTVPHVEHLVRAEVSGWSNPPEIVTETAARHDSYGRADAALAASGTVLLELALAGVPAVSCYRTDLIMRTARRMITVWSAALPNIIVGKPAIPELFDLMMRPNYAARHLRMIMEEGAARQAQLDAFAQLREIMATDQPAGAIAAETLLGLLKARST